jgi:hypothetical protein
MNASVCLSYNHDVFEMPEIKLDALADLVHNKHRAAMSRAHEILCPVISNRSEILEILDSVRSYQWLDVA